MPTRRPNGCAPPAPSYRSTWVGVAAWAVSHHAVAQQILEDPRFLMNSRNWGALQRGEVPEGWPLM